MTGPWHNLHRGRRAGGHRAVVGGWVPVGGWRIYWWRMYASVLSPRVRAAAAGNLDPSGGAAADCQLRVAPHHDAHATRKRPPGHRPPSRAVTVPPQQHGLRHSTATAAPPLRSAPAHRPTPSASARQVPLAQADASGAASALDHGVSFVGFGDSEVGLIRRYVFSPVGATAITGYRGQSTKPCVGGYAATGAVNGPPACWPWACFRA